MIITIPDQFDSKFRFILVAAERAKQLQNGASTKIETKTRKAAHVALEEVQENLIPYKIVEEEEEE
jgi:DNA-directed RNA polymerase subunit omega